MPDELLPIDQILTRLTEQPPRIAALTADLSPDQLHTANPDEWSANDVLAHLRSCADMWGGYIMKIIDEDQPSFRAVSPRTWIKKTNYRELEFHPSLDAFIAQREELLAVLNALPPEDWLRAATVTAAGRVYDPTVQRYADRLARHEAEHIRQIEQMVKTANLTR